MAIATSKVKRSLATLLILVGSACSSFAAVTGGFSVDIANREEVRTFFNAVYGHRADVRSEWTGSVANCEPGATSQTYKDSVLTRINFYRAMIGVPAGVTFRDDYSLRSAHAALIMSANDEISHFPVEGWSCFTELGAEGADNSNLALGSAGVSAIDAYMLDAGPNYRVGHRRWVIYPKTQIMGTGDIDPPDGSDEQRANSLWIFDDHFGDPRPKTRESFVAWPPPGYVPNTLVFPRWSFQVSGANFTNCVVTVSSNGTPVAVHKEKVETGYGENGVVFVPHGIAPQTRMFWPVPAEDVRYSVQIENIVHRGVVTNYAYEVFVFDPAKPLGDWASVRLAGSSSPAANRVNRYALPAFPKASAYDFRTARLEPLATVEGAEADVPDVTPWTSLLYPLVQTNIAASGSKAFHLAHSKPPRPQWFKLNYTIVPSAASELHFKSRLGGATPEQVARVEVSLDDGSSWREIYAQAGTGGSGELSFAHRTVSLRAYAGRAISIRFNYGFIFGPVSFARGSDPGVGWYVDDIEVIAAQRIGQAETVSSNQPSFRFIPKEPGDFFLDARPRFYDEYRGEWSHGTFASAVPPEPTRVAAGRIRQTSGDTIEIDFTAESLAPDASLSVESAGRVDGPWEAALQAEVESGQSENTFRAVLPKSASAQGFYRIVVR